MTIAISLKVGDAVVMGVDSAGSLMSPTGFENVYFNSEKLLNLICGLPVGLATAGVGGFGGRSTIRLARDLRDALALPGSEFYVNPATYSLQEVAEHVKTFFYERLYRPQFEKEADPSVLQFLLCGYSAQETGAEVWSLDMAGANCHVTQAYSAKDPDGLIWRGQGEPLTRLIRGWANDAAERLIAKGIPQDEVLAALDTVAPLWHPAMPIQDAIDLVRYLVEVVCGYVRFAPGHLSVAPPVEVAAITVHEGFRWIDRKHYYRPELNPPEKYTPRLGASAP